MNSLRTIRAGKIAYGRNNVKGFRGWGGEQLVRIERLAA